MRVTTQMLNKSAMRAGLPIHQNSLLDYINNKNQSTDSAINALNSNTTNTANKSKLEKQAKVADELNTQIQKFTAKDAKNILDQAKESGDMKDFCKNIKALAEKYNSMYSILNRSANTMDMFYKQGMNDLFFDNEKELNELGISRSKDGSLIIDNEKLSAASPEAAEKLFGKDSAFLSKLSYLTKHVENSADAGLRSISNNYLPNGIASGHYTSKYDFKG